MDTAKKLLVACYARVSTDNQIENYSIDEQISRLKSYCDAKDWQIVKTYVDGGYSGGNTDRPALQQLLKDIRTGMINAVIVYKLDRLSRSQKDTLTLIEDEFLTHNVDFISINENFDTSTPFGRAMIGILSVFAQLEKDQITERFTMGRIGRSKAGYFHGGAYAPTGYIYKDGELIIDEYKAIQVQEVYNMFLKGKSINGIQGHMENKYGSWSTTTVYNVLRNSTYTGKVKFKGEEYEGHHKPIIDHKSYDEVQKLMTSNNRYANAAQKTPFRAEYLLSSLIYCGNCGAKYSAAHGYYKCYSRSKTNKKYIIDPTCKNDNWKISELDNIIINAIKELLNNENNLAIVLKSSEKNNTPVIDRESLANKVKDIDKQISRVLDLYQLGTIPMNTLTERINELTKEKKHIEKQLSANESKSNDNKQNFLETLSNFEATFSTADIDNKRILVSSLISAITVSGNDISIKWRV